MLLQKLREYDHIIWDWNGTLLSDVEHVWRANVRMLEKRQLPTLSFSNYRKHFCFPIINYYKILGFDLDEHPFEDLAKEYLVEYDELVRDAELFEGTEQLLEALRAEGKTLAVLSAAEQQHLETILSRYGIDHYFSYIYGLSDTYGFSKVERGFELLRATGFDPRRTILVGDTDHDLQVGTALGVDVLLIADGHQEYEKLASLHHNVLPSRFPC